MRVIIPLALFALALIGDAAYWMRAASAATFLPKNFDQLVTEADVVFVGSVISMQARRLPDHLIVTDVTFAVSEVLKGAPAADYVLEVVGGTVGDETLVISDLPAFEVGKAYVLFVRGNGTALFPVVGGDQGVFRVEAQDGGDAVVVDSRGAPPTEGLLGAVRALTADTPYPATQQLTLDSFLHAIRMRVAR